MKNKNLVCAQEEADGFGGEAVYAYFQRDPTRCEWDMALESDDVPTVEVPEEWEDRMEEPSPLSKSQRLLRYKLGVMK